MVVRGVKMRDPLKKCHFGTILFEELTNFTAVVDSDNMMQIHCEMPSILKNKPGALSYN